MLPADGMSVSRGCFSEGRGRILELMLARRWGQRFTKVGSAVFQAQVKPM